MENIIYNELLYRGWSVDVGVVNERVQTKDGKLANKQLEIDFVANRGGKRVYVQSAFAIPDSTKERQEKRSLELTKDSFKKIVVVKDIIKPWLDDNGTLTMGLFDFLLNPADWE